MDSKRVMLLSGDVHIAKKLNASRWVTRGLFETHKKWIKISTSSAAKENMWVSFSVLFFCEWLVVRVYLFWHYQSDMILWGNQSFKPFATNHLCGHCWRTRSNTLQIVSIWIFGWYSFGSLKGCFMIAHFSFEDEKCWDAILSCKAKRREEMWRMLSIMPRFEWFKLHFHMATWATVLWEMWRVDVLERLGMMWQV